MDLTNTIIARVAGAIFLLFGIGLVFLAIWIAWVQLGRGGPPDLTAMAMAAVFAFVCAFFFLVGYRLLFNRPNLYGSILTPVGWRIFAGFFVAVAVALVARSIGRGAYALLGASVLLLGWLAYAALVAGRDARAGRSAAVTRSAVFPPETSLLRMDGFAPAGFRCGIEILNDDRTPMEFVVSVLSRQLGFSKADALRTTLYIHQRGGVLLPRDSLDEAKRMADALAEEARMHNHPLICRAVSLEEPDKPSSTGGT